MKKYFFIGVFLLVVFELANVYFIMPMPGSQRMESVGLAYFLHSWRWVIRSLMGLLILLGFLSLWKVSKVWTMLCLVMVSAVQYIVHCKLAADTMFLQPEEVILTSADQSQVGSDRLILGFEYDGKAAAFPVQYLGYHHQVRATVGGRPFMITYCTVCRTGRVYEPIINGIVDEFRLVGMDHFNAMFEDKTSGTWWRQVSGEAVAGPLKGQFLPEWPSWQGSLEAWLTLHPGSLIMQPDPVFATEYNGMDDFESGRHYGNLTRYDTTSWNEKSWVVGVSINGVSKAYDWNDLQANRILQDEIGEIPLLIVLAEDGCSFFAFKRLQTDQVFDIHHDTLSDGQHDYNISGLSFDSLVLPLQRIQAYQEYWHSWRTFHPETSRFIIQ